MFWLAPTASNKLKAIPTSTTKAVKSTVTPREFRYSSDDNRRVKFSRLT